MSYTTDKELATYRGLIEEPESFQDGFDIKTIIGAVLLGLLITPGSIYIMLFAGEGVGPAARWVTIFLFSEVARRSLKELKQQEIFVLYYMTSNILITDSTVMMLPLWKIFMAKSKAFHAMGITPHIPDWVVPSSILENGSRNLFTAEWLPAIGLIIITMVISRIDHFGLGYFLYRVTSDVERLPFPMAPIGASGILAMADTKDKKLQWRPACFAIGGVAGMIFGAFYMGIPAVTGLILRKPIYILPVPWIEMTPTFEGIFPATAVNLVPSLGSIILGMVLPFWAIVGGFLGLIVTFILNPVLHDGGILRTWFGIDYHGGILHSWQPGMKTVDTLFCNTVDFYFSFTLGITIFIAVLGLIQLFWPLVKSKLYNTCSLAPNRDDAPSKWDILVRGKPERGDISVWLSLGIYVFTTCSYLLISTYLVDGFPWPFFLVYGFAYIPLMGYASARIEGIAGQNVTIPMVKEATFILSGYKGVAIWYAPIPTPEYSDVVRDFRVIELTGTRLGSIIKTDLCTLPIIAGSLIVFSGFIWAQAPLDSDNYPYVQTVWDLMSKNQALMISSTMEGKRSLFFEALRGEYISYGFLGAGILYVVLSFFSLPTLLVFGLVRGLGQTNPANLLPEFIGALIGRYYFQRRFGAMWYKYTPAIYAGFTCGIGLIGMLTIGIKLIAKAIMPESY